MIGFAKHMKNFSLNFLSLQTKHGPCVVFPPLPARAGNFSTVDGVSKFALAIFRWTWSHHFQAARQIRAP